MSSNIFLRYKCCSSFYLLIWMIVLLTALKFLCSFLMSGAPVSSLNHLEKSLYFIDSKKSSISENRLDIKFKRFRKEKMDKTKKHAESKCFKEGFKLKSKANTLYAKAISVKNKMKTLKNKARLNVL